MELNGKAAIVTGGTKGIGRAIAWALVRQGVNVCISARHEDEIKRAVAELGRVGEARVTGMVCDVRDYEEVRALVKHTVEELGGVDILVNNAGIGLFGRVEDLSPEDFRAVLETNLFGVFYCCHEAIPQMKRRGGGGYIINISSLAGVNAHPQMAAYNASKFGLNGFSEALMQEVRHDRIKVSYIMPGSVNTHFGDDEPSEEKSWQLQPEDIAQVVIDLLNHPERSLPSRVEIRPSTPPKK
ncbi:MAG TPA: SDR family oxidoreductase [Pyrinomonadaceae bacterium]|jgi:NAD(P)-dependent dehydrogenase (short-subunit alcohol dehydrogenase family)|nr:SDR family oxidoreductase [Pyrinomonadaceae bacterium]